MSIAAIHWNVDPELLKLGPITVRWYGLLFAAGFMIGFVIMTRIYRREDKPIRDLDSLLITLMISTVVGARLAHCLIYEPGLYLKDPIEILKVWKGGLASHGGVVGILVGLYFFCRKRPDQPYLWLIDRLCVPAALTAALIRLGNLFNSEIVGTRSDLPWAVVFERNNEDFARHPAQMYESLSYFALFLVLVWIYRRKGASVRPGLLAGLLLTEIFAARFLIEFVKERQAEYGQDLALSVGQLLSIIPVLAGVALLIYGPRFARKPAPSSPEAGKTAKSG
ncbi:MAG: prolipoprotein diacylglyceryl transferase [Planctomycetota bacterium]